MEKSDRQMLQEYVREIRKATGTKYEPIDRVHSTGMAIAKAHHEWDKHYDQ